ncbi:MAG: SDR family oxidoreductase [Pseudomonadota bacterium]|nr:SDR family oxidoreductase [Pseudomonadota bacterium]
MNDQIMKGKRGLIMGVANDHSLAWGIANKLHQNGADLAFTYQGETFKKRVEPLADSINCIDNLIDCDVLNENELVDAYEFIKDKWGKIDFIVHSIAHSDKNELNGKYIDTSRENFLNTLEISCFSLTNITKIFEPIINDNGSILTLTYGGSERVIPNYNVMGVAKAALESSVRYLAVDLGGRGIRINALSAGMMRTLAGSAVKNARSMFKFDEKHKPLKDIPLNFDDIGSSGLYLISDLSRGVSGEIHYVDQGYNVIGMPKTDDL